MQINPINNNCSPNFGTKVIVTDKAKALLQEMSINAPEGFNFKALAGQLKNIEKNGKDDIFMIDRAQNLKSLWMVVKDPKTKIGGMQMYTLEEAAQGVKLQFGRIYQKVSKKPEIKLTFFD